MAAAVEIDQAGPVPARLYGQIVRKLAVSEPFTFLFWHAALSPEKPCWTG